MYSENNYQHDLDMVGVSTLRLAFPVCLFVILACTYDLKDTFCGAEGLGKQ